MSEPNPMYNSRPGDSAELQNAELRVLATENSIALHVSTIESLKRNLLAAVDALEELKKRIALDEKSRLK